MEMWLIWLIVCGMFLFLEIITVAFFLFWPGTVAFICFLLALIGVSIPIQIGIFCVLSIVLMVFTKPLTDKYLKVKDANLNVKSVVGKQGKVLKTIDNLNSKGQVKISGEVWSAISKDGDIIPVDSIIEVLEVKGVKVIVKSKEEI